ncbi:hypothetical protein QUF64_10190 [Anaerolineales bacterium HSG6]|nr:hypothetical protein [Anaerolineales bacterium HSG6]
MEIAENIILGLPVIWLIWYPIVLRQRIIKGLILVPFMVTAWFLFIGFTAIVILFDLSCFHLIWMFVLSFVAGLGVIIFPPVQMAVIYLMILLSLTGTDDAGVEVFEDEPKPKRRKQKPKKRRRHR